MKSRKKIAAVAAVIMVSLVLLAGSRAPDIYFLIKKNFTIFSEVYKEVSLNYVDEVDPEQLMHNGLDAMLKSLDPYTVLIDDGENQDLEIMTRGNYGGIGLEVGTRDDRIVVIAPLEGYPADRNGIRPGDELISVQGIPVSELTPKEVRDLTMGEPGSEVTLTINRFGAEQNLTFEMQRERINVKNIAHASLIGDTEDIGYIVLTRFSQNSGDEIHDVLTKWKDHTELSGVILDLRNNPGGLLEEAVETLDSFLPAGITVVETRGRSTEQNGRFRTDEPALMDEIPLVILQNHGSASASEIVAGALQDLDRAVIIGERSFGKGLVQTIRPISYNNSLKITTSRYYIPSGRSIQSVEYQHDEGFSKLAPPDSAVQVYKTRNGRTVYEGEGITPDIEMNGLPSSLLEASLRQQNHFFFFANEYQAENDSLPSSGVSDALFDRFLDYLERDGFNYETPAEYHLNELTKRISESEELQEITDELDELAQTIEQEKQQQFRIYKEELKKTLYNELVVRYKGREGQYVESIKNDPFVLEAIDFIADSGRYREILAIQ